MRDKRVADAIVPAPPGSGPRTKIQKVGHPFNRASGPNGPIRRPLIQARNNESGASLRRRQAESSPCRKALLGPRRFPLARGFYGVGSAGAGTAPATLSGVEAVVNSGRDKV